METDIKVWQDHFEYHATRRHVMPRATPNDLTPYEQRLISRSLARFQRSQRLESGFLRRAPAPLARIIQLLREEKAHHVDLIDAFMHQHAITRIRESALNRLFRQAQTYASFELQIALLVTNELISKVCLRALEGATGSTQLKTLCRMFVADELAHVGFECDLMREIQARRRLPLRVAADLLLRIFFFATSLVAFVSHRPVLKSVGYTLRTFLRACSAQYAFYLEEPPLRAARAAAE